MEERGRQRSDSDEDDENATVTKVLASYKSEINRWVTSTGMEAPEPVRVRFAAHMSDR